MRLWLSPSTAFCLSGGALNQLGGGTGAISPSLLAAAEAGASGNLDAGGADASSAFASLGVGIPQAAATAASMGAGTQGPQSALLAAAAQSLRLANALTTGANNGSLSSVVLVSNLNEEVRAMWDSGTSVWDTYASSIVSPTVAVARRLAPPSDRLSL